MIMRNSTLHSSFHMNVVVSHSCRQKVCSTRAFTRTAGLLPGLSLRDLNRSDHVDVGQLIHLAEIPLRLCELVAVLYLSMQTLPLLY